MKDSPTLRPLSREYQFPKEPSYDNPIIGFIHVPGYVWTINIIMSNGEQSNLPIREEYREDYEEVRINPADAAVKKVVVYSCRDLEGIRFYDKDDTILLKAGDPGDDSYHFAECILEEGQRLIGVKSRVFIDDDGAAYQFDFRFIIGWQE